MVKLNWPHTRRFFMAALWMDFSSGMFIVALPYLALSLGAKSMQLGQIGAVRGLAYMLACVPAAILSDRSNRRTLILVSSVCATGALMLVARVTNLWQLGAVSVLWSAALAFFWPSLFGWLGDSHPKEQLGRAAGSVNVGWSIGVMSGGVVAGWLYEGSHSLPFIIAGLPAMLACFIMVAGTTSRHGRPAAPPTGPAQPGTKRRLAAAWLGNTTVCCMIGLISGVFPELGLKLGVTSAVFGVLLAVFGVGRTLVYLSALTRWRHLEDWRLVIVAQLVAAGMVATVASAGSHLWLALVFAVSGVAGGAAYYLALFRSLEGEGSRGLKSGIHEAALLGGLLIGTLGGGTIADRWGLRAPYVPTACVVGLLVVVQIALNLSAGRARVRAFVVPPEPPKQML